MTKKRRFKKKLKKTSVNDKVLIDIINNRLSMISLSVLSNITGCTLWKNQRTKENLRLHIRRSYSQNVYTHRQDIIDFILEDYAHEIIPTLSKNGTDFICEEHVKFEIFQHFFNEIKTPHDLYYDKHDITIDTYNDMLKLDDIIDNAIILDTSNLDDDGRSKYPMLKKGIFEHIENNLTLNLKRRKTIKERKIKIERLKEKISA